MSPQHPVRELVNRPRPTLQTWFYRFVGLELLIYVLDNLRGVVLQAAQINLPLAAKVISLSAVASLLFWCGQQCREAEE
jgi:hypothetical protein